jgi:hypothetical protein
MRQDSVSRLPVYPLLVSVHGSQFKTSLEVQEAAATLETYLFYGIVS